MFSVIISSLHQRSLPFRVVVALTGDVIRDRASIGLDLPELMTGSTDDSGGKRKVLCKHISSFMWIGLWECYQAPTLDMVIFSISLRRI